MKIFGMVHTEPSLRYTKTALQTFFEHTPLDSSDEFYLIDNDRSVTSSLIAPYPDISVINNSKPFGFAENLNQIISVAAKKKADLFFLNNDLIFTPDWIAPLLMSDDAIVAPLSNRELQYDSDVFSTTVSMSLEDYLGKEQGLKQLVHVHRTRSQGYLNVVALPFFAVKIPYTAYMAVGYADEAYGKGGAEDYDYCLRANLAGIPTRYALSSYIVHFGGKSSWSGPESKKQQDAREEQFKAVFQDKWGESLFRLLFLEDQSVVLNDKHLSAATEAGNHKLVIESLMPA